MDIITTKLHIGVAEPFKVLHISDTHITYADLRDGERKVEMAKERFPIFPHAEEMLTAIDKLSKETGAPIVCTGDLIDFVSTANLERAKAFVDEHDLFMAAGNHEFAQYVGIGKEDAAYRNESLAKVQAAFKNDIRLSSRIIGGVNFIALDNGYYLFDEEQFAFLKNEVAKGYPIILLVHTPFYERALYDAGMASSTSAYLLNVPEELMRDYPPFRYEQQLADSITREVDAYIRSEPLIKAIIAGHIHENYEGMITDTLPQYAINCTTIRIFEIT